VPASCCDDMPASCCGDVTTSCCDDVLTLCCDDVPASCCDDVLPALCCDANLVLKTLNLVLMLIILQPSCYDVIVFDDSPTFVL
jgi:hypothetical protein